MILLSVRVKIKSTLFFILLLVTVLVQAQLHLGKTRDELIAVLGTNNVNLTDEEGDDVVAYINEIKGHPKYGDYTLYSIYVFENNKCIMQRTVMPVAQEEDIIKGFNLKYEKVGDMAWKSKDSIYYVLSADKDNLRTNIMSESVYDRKRQ